MSAMREEVFVEEGLARLEPRIARIESDVASLKETAVRLNGRFDQVDERFKQVDERFNQIDQRFDKIDRRFEKIDERFGKLDGKIEGLGLRMTRLEQGFDDMNESQTMMRMDLRDLRNSVDSKFLWILTTMFAFGAAILAAMAQGFHWFK
jgi:chromosome segregation ATPase